MGFLSIGAMRACLDAGGTVPVVSEELRTRDRADVTVGCMNCRRCEEMVSTGQVVG